MLERVRKLVSRITLSCLDKELKIRINPDQKGGDRIFVQIYYTSRCAETNKPELWRGRKYYLSQYMTDDEIVKTVYLAFEQAVKHEVMEGFRVDNKILFNPHLDFEALLSVSNKIVKRKDIDEVA